MKKVKNIVIVGRQCGEGSVDLTLKGVFTAKLIFERFEQWEDGIKTAKNRIGEKSPDCCQVPTEKGLFSCDCGRHLISNADYEEPEKSRSVFLRQIIELPECVVIEYYKGRRRVKVE